MLRRDPSDWITVYGGKQVAKIDADAVRLAASRMSAASNHLNTSANQLSAGVVALQQTAQHLQQKSVLPNYELGNHNQYSEAMRLANTQVASVSSISREINAITAECQQINTKLLKAAGLYEFAETEASIIQKVNSGLKYGSGYLIAAAVGTIGIPYNVFGVPSLLHLGLNALTTRTSEFNVNQNREDGNSKTSLLKHIFLHGLVPPKVKGMATFLCSTLFTKLLRQIQLALTDVSAADSFILGIIDGSALFSPQPNTGQPTINRAAAMWRGLFAGLIPPTQVVVQRAYPELDPSYPPIPWQNEPISSTDDLLSRLGDLHNRGGEYPDNRTKVGLPEGTFVVDRVTHSDGSISYNVLIPATQGFNWADDPFDGLTDLDLMAGDWSDVQEAVCKALEMAGANPGDKVVLAGHSLGGIAARSLASDSSFTAKYQIAGLVTVGAPIGYFNVHPSVPALQLENLSDVVPKVEGLACGANSQSENQVTICADLRQSDDPEDREAGTTIAGSHELETYRKVWHATLETGNYQVLENSKTIEAEMSGVSVETMFFTTEREPEIIRK